VEAPASAACPAAAHISHPAAGHGQGARRVRRLRSWLELQRDLPFEGTPVLSDEEFDRAAEEIESIVSSAREPVYA